MELNGNGVFAYRFQGIVELDFATVNVEAFALQFGRDVSGGDRAEQLFVLARTSRAPRKTPGKHSTLLI